MMVMETGSSSKRKVDDKNPEMRVLSEHMNEIRGPTSIFHLSDPSPMFVDFNSTVRRRPMELLDQTPKDVSQS